jgi:hypothetical protein
VLQFALNDGLRLMLVPSGGFGWVIGDHEVADQGHSECMLGLSRADQADVDELVERGSPAPERDEGKRLKQMRYQGSEQTTPEGVTAA